MDKKLISSYEGLLEINGAELDCFVLNDGTRIISQNGILRSFGRKKRGVRRVTKGDIKMPPFMDARNLEPLITEELWDLITPISFKTKDNIESSGYKAEIIPLVCDLYLKARENGILTASQLEVAKKAEVLVRSLAKTAIVALVDEATGYQYDREKNELQKILKAYISEELLPWQKRFPDEFYIELFRLNKWNFTVKGIKKRPGVVGRWTNTLIYEQLPKGILEELKSKTPKGTRLHQSLTLDVGEPNLTAQINQVLTIFRLSDNMEHMWSNFKRMNDRKHGQMELDFSFDDNGATIPIDPPIKDKPLSGFDKGLKKMLRDKN